MAVNGALRLSYALNIVSKSVLYILYRVLYTLSVLFQIADGRNGRGECLCACLTVHDHFVTPSPATHAILAQLKAGETVHQVGEVPKTFRVSKIHYESSKTVCKTLFASIFPPSMENGDGIRSLVKAPTCSAESSRTSRAADRAHLRGISPL